MADQVSLSIVIDLAVSAAEAMAQSVSKLRRSRHWKQAWFKHAILTDDMVLSILVLKKTCNFIRIIDNQRIEIPYMACLRSSKCNAMR